MDQNRAAFAGQIADVPVPDLIRTITGDERSGVVHFETTLGRATLWFADGALLDARMGRFTKEAAVERLAQVGAGTFEVTYEPVWRPAAMETPMTELLARLEGTEPPASERVRRRRPGASWRPTAGGRPAAKLDAATPAPSGQVRAMRSTEMTERSRRPKPGAKEPQVGPPLRTGHTAPHPAVPAAPANDARDRTVVQPVPPPPKPSAIAVESGDAPVARGSIGVPSEPTAPMADAATERARRAQTVAQAVGLPPSMEPGVPTAIVPADSQPSASPAVVGRYEVLLRIARGGMGTVYLCRITGEGGFRRLFALKVIRDHLSRNPEYVEMLLQEARIASRLHHPNVVGIVDIGTFAEQHYLVMDYVEGCTFSDLLKLHPSDRPPHLIVPIMLDALTGLHAAHTLTEDDGSPLTLVHCDVSPQNMLVGTNGVCRITDFGVARAERVFQRDTAGEHARVTRGKPAYLSPEQVLGEHLDHRSDIFSAGVVLWNALTGSQLFGGDSPEAVLRQVLERPIPPPSTTGLRPPSCFDKVVLRALQRDRTRRYQSAEEMLIELRRVAITQDYLAPPSEVATWVTSTFGQQLELRRRAAGIAKTPSPESQAIALRALPESPPAGMPVPSAEESMSRTTILRPEHLRRASDVRSLQRLAILGVATLGAAALIVVGLIRPDWIRGGVVNDYGDYVVKERVPVGADQEAETDDPGATDGDQAETSAADAIDQGDDVEPAAEEGTGTRTDEAVEIEVERSEQVSDTEGDDPEQFGRTEAGSQDPTTSPRKSKPRAGSSRDASDAEPPTQTPPRKPPPLQPPDLPDLARTGDENQ